MIMVSTARMENKIPIGMITRLCENQVAYSAWFTHSPPACTRGVYHERFQMTTHPKSLKSSAEGKREQGKREGKRGQENGKELVLIGENGSRFG